MVKEVRFQIQEVSSQKTTKLYDVLMKHHEML